MTTIFVFLISLTGIPPTVGFVAKVFVIVPVLDAGYAWLAVGRFSLDQLLADDPNARPTAEYLQYVLSRLTAPGSVYLGIIALFPLVALGAAGVANQIRLRDRRHIRCPPRGGGRRSQPALP